MNGNKRKHVEYQLNSTIFNSLIIQKLINNFMKQGKIYAAYKILFYTFRKIKKTTSQNPKLLLQKSIYTQKLPIELISVKKSGRVYKLPMVVNIERQIKTILRIFSDVTKENKKTSSGIILSKEIVDSLTKKKKTLVTKKLESICKIAVDNQPFMHFRWSGSKRKRLKKRKKPVQIS